VTEDDSPPPSPDRAGLLGLLIGSVALAVAYYTSARIGLTLATVGGSVTLIWPPVGLAVAALFRGGYRYAPGAFVGAFAVSLELLPAGVAAGVAAGNTAGAVATAALLRRLRLDPGFRTLTDAGRLLAAALVGTAVSAANGAVWVCGPGGGGWDRLGAAFVTWWAGDVGGVLVAAPAVLAWGRGRLGRGAAASVVGMGGLCVVVFTDLLPDARWCMPLTFLPYFLAARSAAAHRAGPATAEVLVLAVAAVWANQAGTGAARYVEPGSRPFILWGYLVSVSGLVLVVAGLMAERDRADRLVRSSEAEYRALVEDNPALICRFRATGAVTFANETARLALGPAVAPGRCFFRATGLADDPAALDRVRRLRFEDPAVTVEARAVGAGGPDRWLRWTVRVVDLTGAFVECHAVGLDVTDQKRAEADRRAVEGHAVQAQRLEAVGVLAAGIAHEFNNLLTGVLGNAELARMTVPPGDPVVEHLDAIAAGAERAAELTRQLMAYAGKAPLARGPVDLNELVRGSAAVLAVAVPKWCRVRVETEDAVPLVTADERLVRQVLLNLVTNAGEAVTDGGAVTVRVGQGFYDPVDGGWVGATPGMARGWYARLEVEDTGCGMPPDVQARLFEPFFTTKFPGRGLGLPAVLGVARDHGGAVRVTSAVGRGTTVTVLFPPLPADPTAGHTWHPEATAAVG
jgi:signal transduction histidine kinase